MSIIIGILPAQEAVHSRHCNYESDAMRDQSRLR